MNEIVLEAHICKERRSFKVIFEGPNAEDMAISFVDSHSSTYAVSEWVEKEAIPHFDETTGEFAGMTWQGAHDQPFLINPEQYPRLYDKLYPSCSHGLSESLCAGPNHYPPD